MENFLKENYQWLIGLVISTGLLPWLIKFVRFKMDESKVYNWLSENTADRPGERFRSCKVISSKTNLSFDRTKEVCTKSKRIRLSTGETPDMWTLREYDKK